MKRLLLLATALLVPAACADTPTQPDLTVPDRLESTVRGKAPHWDADGNGYPDEGVTVTGTYKSIYAYDANGDYYWDLGDGRVRGTVGSVDDLDDATLTACYYKVQYRGNFENDPFLDSGWIKNEIKCKGVDDGNYNYTIVHETDPRYTGNPDWAIWGSWEYHGYVVGGVGNLVRPENRAGS